MGPPTGPWAYGPASGCSATRPPAPDEAGPSLADHKVSQGPSQVEPLRSSQQNVQGPDRGSRATAARSLRCSRGQVRLKLAGTQNARLSRGVVLRTCLATHCIQCCGPGDALCDSDSNQTAVPTVLFAGSRSPTCVFVCYIRRTKTRFSHLLTIHPPIQQPPSAHGEAAGEAAQAAEAAEGSCCRACGTRGRRGRPPSLRQGLDGAQALTNHPPTQAVGRARAAVQCPQVALNV